MFQKMLEVMTMTPWLAILFIIVVAIVLCLVVIKFLQHIGLEKIRAVVYEGFLKAEHEFKYGDNHQKFEYVVQLARSSLPSPFNIFITEALLRNIVQLWFDLIKDLLNDGKINGVGPKRE